jgi:hypothetical protein
VDDVDVSRFAIAAILFQPAGKVRYHMVCYLDICHTSENTFTKQILGYLNHSNRYIFSFSAM